MVGWPATVGLGFASLAGWRGGSYGPPARTKARAGRSARAISASSSGWAPTPATRSGVRRGPTRTRTMSVGTPRAPGTRPGGRAYLRRASTTCDPWRRQRRQRPLLAERRSGNSTASGPPCSNSRPHHDPHREPALVRDAWLRPRPVITISMSRVTVPAVPGLLLGD